MLKVLFLITCIFLTSTVSAKEFISMDNRSKAIQKFKDAIARGESRGSYNAMNQGTKTITNSKGEEVEVITGSSFDSKTNKSWPVKKSLTDLTLREVMEYQSLPNGDKNRIFAAGKYQIIPDTMIDLLKKLPEEEREALKNSKFDSKVQEKLGNLLIFKKRPAVGNYLLGKSSDKNEAMLELAREFASIPNPATGNSYYGSGNAAFHTVDEVAGYFDEAKKSYKDEQDSVKMFNTGDEDINRFPDKETGTTKAAPSATAKPPIKEGPSQNVDYPDLTGRPFKEAFTEAREELKSPIFRWKGKLYHTQTPEEVVAGITGKTETAAKAEVEAEPKMEAEPKEEGVEKYLDKAPEPLGEYKPAPGDMLGGDIFSMAPRYPVPDIMDKEEDKPKSKVSDILKKTTDENYDKMGFDKAFAQARKKGKNEFPWRGKSYTTKYKEEM